MRNHLKTALLMGLLSALVMGVGNLVAPGQLALFAALAVAMNLGAYFFADRLVLRMHRAVALDPADAPELHATVRELAARAGIPTPRLYLVPDGQPNAFATGRSPAHGVVAVTEGIVDLLTPRELRAVLAHEIAHIKNRDILVSTVAAAAASIVTYVVQSSLFAGLFGGRTQESGEESPSLLGNVLVVLFAPLAATLVQLGISRAREHMADDSGARISGDPEGLASALAKLARGAAIIPSEAAQPATASLFIVNPLAGTGGKLRRLFSTHPPTEERVQRLLEMARHASRRPSIARAWARTPAFGE